MAGVLCKSDLAAGLGVLLVSASIMTIVVDYSAFAIATRPRRSVP
jgi:hypothetical protein